MSEKRKKERKMQFENERMIQENKLERKKERKKERKYCNINELNSYARGKTGRKEIKKRSQREKVLKEPKKEEKMKRTLYRRK